MTSLFTNFQSPGVRVVERSEGFRALEIASFQNVYMVGSASTGDYLTPTQVTSLADFTNVFGASPSEASVKLFFRNDRNGILYFVRTPIAPRSLVSVESVAAGAYTVTTNGTAVTYTAIAEDTEADIVSGLIEAINQSAVANLVSASTTGVLTDSLIVRNDDPLAAAATITVSANLAVADITPNQPTSVDYIYAIENSFDVEDEYPQGFLIAPQVFQLLTVQSDRLAVGSAMEGLASDKSFDWIALVDAGANLTISQAQSEGLLYNSPQGHTSFYYPYLIDLEDGTVPASAGVAGVATRRFKAEGLQQPAAGSKFPVLGVKDVTVRVNTQQQETLNPLGINIIRNLRNKGVVVWAMRTRSNSEFYKFMPTRVTMNVLNGTLRRGFDNEVFSSIDGFGILLNNIAATARSVCSRFWRSKLLFGATEADAFEVICDFTNNSREELENGNVLCEVYAVPSPTMERLLISTVRVSIGALPLTRPSLADPLTNSVAI